MKGDPAKDEIIRDAIRAVRLVDDNVAMNGTEPLIREFKSACFHALGTAENWHVVRAYQSVGAQITPLEKRITAVEDELAKWQKRLKAA